MLNINYVFCFSCFRESGFTKFTKTLHEKIVSFSHFLNPESKLYSNLKYISSLFCEFFFTTMYKIIETSFKTSISYPYKSPFYRHRFLKSLRFANSGETAEKMKGGRGEGWKGGPSGLVKVGRMFFWMKFENTYDIIFLFLLITALKFDRFPNSCEPAAAVGLLSQSVTCESSLPKSSAAGLLFCGIMVNCQCSIVNCQGNKENTT